MTAPNTEQMNERPDATILFKNWVRLTSDGSGIQSDFENFELKEREDEWFELDSSSHRAQVEAERRHLQKYANGEFLAHHLAYQDLTTVPTQRVLEDDGSYREYHCTRLEVDNTGLVGYILVPTSVDENTTPDIKVIFRGTKCAASVARDLELGGPGSISFARNRDAILQQINNAIKTFNTEHSPLLNPINISIAGHSLGGADAQNCLTAMMEAISQNNGLTDVDGNIPAEKRNYFDTIKRLRLFDCNAGGVPETTEKRSADLAAFLAQKRAIEQTSVQIESYNQHVDGDGVQQTGEGHVLSNVPPSHAKVDVLKAQIGYGHRNIVSLPMAVTTTVVAGAVAGPVGTLVAAATVGGAAALGVRDTVGAHTTHLCKQPMEVRYQQLSNATLEGQKQAHAELSKKSWWLNKIHQAAGMLFGFEKHKERTAQILVTPELGVAEEANKAAITPELGVAEKQTNTPWYKAAFPRLFGRAVSVA